MEDDAAVTQDRNNASSLTDANNDDDMDVDDVEDMALVDEVGCNGPDEDDEDKAAVVNLMDGFRNEQEHGDKMERMNDELKTKERKLKSAQ